MEIHRGDVQLLEVPHTDKTSAIESLVSDSGARDSRPTRSELEERRSLSDISESTDTLYAKAARLKGMTTGKEYIVPTPRRKAVTAVSRTQHRGRNASAATLRVASPFRANLGIASARVVGMLRQRQETTGPDT